MSQLRVDLPPDLPPQEAAALLGAKLYENGRLSLGQAARLAGYSKRAFMEVLGKQGIAVFDYPVDELAEELED